MDLFLARFREEAELMEINKKRIIGFIKNNLNKDLEHFDGLEPDAAEFIQTLNNLGFLTTDSQEGIYRESKDPIDLNGEPLVINGSRVTLKVYSERSYCDAFIRTDILGLFIENLAKENEKVNLIVHPYDGCYICVTKEYFEDEDSNNYVRELTRINARTEEDVEWELSELSNGSAYYTGPPLEILPIDLSRWTFVTAFDMEWGHHALENTGLFKSIERALIKSLNNYV